MTEAQLYTIPERRRVMHGAAALADFSDALTPDETEMLAAAAGGPTAEDKAVARAMGLSPEAVAAERGRMQIRDHLGGDPREVEVAAAKERMNAR